MWRGVRGEAENAPPTAREAVFLRLPKTWREPAETRPKRPPMGLESLRPAQERPSGGSHPGTPTVLSRQIGNEAASWGKTQRHSAGRPRKVSQ